ncbi:MAG TPA: GNAT family N-acetyltransferase [Micromonosporaceae bacterium]
MSQMEIRETRYGSPVARALVAAAMAELGARYGGEGDETPVVPSEFDPPDGGFYVAYLDGAPVGCCGWRSFERSEDVAELKRMYVDPSARGNGVGRALLRAVEEAARAHGRKRMILECGDRQPEAISLYESEGYERIEDFGHYKGAEGVRSFGRTL